jgi:hypothetical protein
MPVKDCVFKSSPQGGGLLVNLKTGNYYTLNPSGQRVWGWIDGARNGGGIARRFSSAYRVSSSLAERDVKSFLDTLRRAGLIRLT